VDLILIRTFLVVGILVADTQNLGIVEDFMMETEDLLVLAVHGGSHGEMK
jgi:hypothetical protein